MERNSRIYVAGHRGLVGSALVRSLEAKGYSNLITRTHAELDLEDSSSVDAFFGQERPEYVFLAAAKVGGIYANSTYPVDFLLRNLKIQNHVLESAWKWKVRALLFLGSSCIYPRLAPQPLKEEYLLSGPLETTNEPYAIAKIAGIELCEAFNRQYGTRFFSVMPTNLFGPGDNYDLQTSHVLPAMIRKFHLAKLALRGENSAIHQDELLFGPIPEDFRGCLNAISKASGHSLPFSSSPTAETGEAVQLWGTGSPRREFLYVDDLSDACIFLMNNLDLIFPARGSQAQQIETTSQSERHVFTVRESAERPPSAPSAQAAPSDIFPQGARKIINIGTGKDSTIKELAETVARIVGFSGQLAWDTSKPDGTPRKLLDVGILSSLGWRPKTSLEYGISLTYQAYLKHPPGGKTTDRKSEV